MQIAARLKRVYFAALTPTLVCGEGEKLERFALPSPSGGGTAGIRATILGSCGNRETLSSFRPHGIPARLCSVSQRYATCPAHDSVVGNFAPLMANLQSRLFVEERRICAVQPYVALLRYGSGRRQDWLGGDIHSKRPFENHYDAANS